MAVEDVFMQLRSQHEDRIYCRKRELANIGEMVVTRNGRRYVTMVNDRWKVTNARRKTHNETGFSSLNTLPYKNFGSFNITDVYDLLGDYLGIDFSKHHAYGQRYMISRLHHQPHTSALKSTGRPNTIEVLDISRNKYRALPFSPTAGLDLLSNKINSDRRILQDMRSGSSLLETLQREEHRQKRLKAIKAPNIIYRGEVKVNINKTFAYLPPMIATASSKICLLSRPPISMVDPSGSDTKPPTKGMLDPDCDPEAARILEAVRRRSFLAKLKSIYSILCCLHNMNTKDLRGYEPLPFSVVKDLSKKLFHTIIVPRPHIGQLNHHHLDQNHQNFEKAYSQSSKPLRWSPTSAHPNLWEDLLDMEHTDSSSPAQRTQRTLPAWKRKIITLEQRDQKTVGLEDHERKMANSIRAFKTLKNEVADKLRILLDHNSMMQGKARSLKMKYFRCGPIMEKSLKEMRDTSYRVRWEEGEEDFNRPEWFVLLTEEMKTIFKEENVTDSSKAALDVLKQFLYLNTCNKPLVIEKLCLLVMSVPANYLCIQQVILAFQFVCEHILKRSPELIATLRDIRRLPAVAELQPLDYLFGHPITA